MYYVNYIYVSIEDERVYGILCIALFPQQRSHRNALEIFCDMKYHVQHPITQKVNKIET